VNELNFRVQLSEIPFEGKPIMSDVVNVALRNETETGTRACRRLRNSGYVPAVLYGHKETVVSLKVKPEEVLAAIYAGHKLVDLKGAVSESALVKKVQWDSLGSDIIHVDFTRVSASELVRTTVLVELKGDAAGLREGGILKFQMHEMDIEAPAASIPEKIFVNVKDLHIDGEIFARDVPLPPGVKLAAHADEIVVSCSKAVDKDDDTLGAPGPTEPELIRKEKAAEDEKE
jgi:large subunit ribosomal protein L25